MASKKTDNKSNVVIVGGGTIGCLVARSLSGQLDPAKYQLFLIDKRPFRILLPPALRMIVTDTGHIEDQALVDFNKVFVNGNGTFIHAAVESVVPSSETTGGHVKLENGEKIDYAVLVLGTGASWTGPLAFPNDLTDAKKFINDYRAKFSKAKSVAFIGGGSVGVELAGEVRDFYPDAKVTVVQGEAKLLNSTYPDRFRDRIEASIKARGVEVILGEFVDEIPEGNVLKTRSEREITAELIVPTWGSRPSIPYLSPSDFALSANGEVKVLPTLQLPNHPDIFAGGDMIQWAEQKQAAKAATHAGIIAKNAVKYLNGTKEAGLAVYKGSPEMILITNGREGGAAYLGILWGIILGDWFARLMKSRGLIIPMLRKQSGY